MNIRFSVPKLCKSPKGWYLHFRYDGKQFRYSLNLNQIADLKAREEEYGILCRAYHERLKEGWNPNTPQVEKKKEMTLSEAIEYGLAKKKAKALKTFAGYNSTMELTKKAIKSLKYGSMPISTIKRIDVKNIVDQMVIENKNEVSNHGYNKYLDHIGAIFSEIVDAYIIEHNPAHNIKRLETEESILHRPPTDEEWHKIKTALISKHYNFYVYVSLIAYWGMRPNEIFSITLGMIDMEKGVLTLPPKANKNRKKYKFLPIIKYIKRDFIKMDFAQLPKEYYLFGSFKESGKGNQGANQFLPGFIPAPTKTKTDTATKLWEKIVKIGLGIDVTMYAMKKYGANKKLKAGIPVDTIQKGM